MKIFHLGFFSCKEILEEKELLGRQKYISCLLPPPPVLQGASFPAHSTVGWPAVCLSALQEARAAAAEGLGPRC